MKYRLWHWILPMGGLLGLILLAWFRPFASSSPPSPGNWATPWLDPAHPPDCPTGITTLEDLACRMIYAPLRIRTLHAVFRLGDGHRAELWVEGLVRLRYEAPDLLVIVRSDLDGDRGVMIARGIRKEWWDENPEPPLQRWVPRILQPSSTVFPHPLASQVPGVADLFLATGIGQMMKNDPHRFVLEGSGEILGRPTRQVKDRRSGYAYKVDLLSGLVLQSTLNGVPHYEVLSLEMNKPIPPDVFQVVIK